VALQLGITVVEQLRNLTLVGRPIHFPIPQHTPVVPYPFTSSNKIPMPSLKSS
jgi:hypothetical protein